MSRKSSTSGIHISFKLNRQQASARTVVLVGAFFLLGLALSAAWFHRNAARSGSPEASGGTEAVLSDATKIILSELSSPVEIRFYSVLDPASVSEATQAFALRAEQLLAAYQSEAGSRLKVSRVQTDVAPQAAAADGILPFNQDKGDPCYLGLVVSSAGQKETFGRLSPEWEAAFEPDLSRAIARVIRKTPPPTAFVASAQPDVAAIAALKRDLPNLASVSVEEGSQTLRDAALEKFKVATAEMQIQVGKAQQRLAEAQSSSSDAEREAATKNFRQVQSEQTAKLQKITADLQAEIEALQRIKQP